MRGKSSIVFLIIVLLSSCTIQEDFSYKEPLSWVGGLALEEEQLIRITRWKTWRTQSKIDQTNYLDSDFWKNYGTNFRTCLFTAGKVEYSLVKLNAANEFVDAGKKQLGISFLDLEWELQIGYEATVLKLSPKANFEQLKSFLQKNEFTEQTKDGLSYYHLTKERRKNYQQKSAVSLSKDDLRHFSNVYMDRKARILVISSSAEAMVASIKAHTSSTISPMVPLLDFDKINEAFKTDCSLVLSNRQYSLKDYIGTQGAQQKLDSRCQKLFKRSYEELKALNEFELTIMGVNGVNQSAKIVVIYEEPKQAKEDHKTRELLILEASSFLREYPWNKSYLTYIDSAVKGNYLFYNFKLLEKGCLNQAVVTRDFPFLVSPN
ncbi:MAG: hypothetical protein ACRBFS_12095 [Aureispira sp.]